MRLAQTPPSNELRSERAFNIIELTIIFTILAILLALLIPATIKTKAKSKRMHCVMNLKNVGLSYRIFATDNQDRFPWETETNHVSLTSFDQFLPFFRSVSNQLGSPKSYACPADSRQPAMSWSSLARENISYFVTPNASQTFPQSFLAGDRNLMTNGIRLPTGITKISTNSLLSWDSDMHKNQGNVALGDGSVQQLSSVRLRQHAQSSTTDNYTLAIP